MGLRTTCPARMFTVRFWVEVKKLTEKTLESISHRDVVCLVWRALAWNEDWFPICGVHSSITVSSTLKTLLEFRDLDT